MHTADQAFVCPGIVSSADVDPDNFGGCNLGNEQSDKQ